jgi:trehalose utilization protein
MGMPGGQKHGEGLRVAVITGWHAFDVPAFFDLLRSMPGIGFFPQELENFVADLGRVRDRYDAVIFYNHHQAVTGHGQPPETKAVLEELGVAGQGIVLWHHGLVAFPRLKLWANLTGLEDRTFTAHQMQTVRVEVAVPGHPIAEGLKNWEMVDETYAMETIPRDSEILLTTEHPLSMKALAWTRQVGRAPVFCYQSGHDRQAYANPSFRTVLARGIRWAAGDLEG